MKDPGVCRLCLQVGALSSSHILPEFMYRPMYSKDHKIFAYQEGPNSLRSQLIQKGFRERLLCAKCESYLNREFEQPNVEPWEALASLDESRAGLKWKDIHFSPTERCTIIKGINYSSFKLLLLSILWRSSVSSLPEFEEVQLGKHEKIIRQALLNRHAGPEGEYPCAITLFTRSTHALKMPERTLFQRHSDYRFLIGTMRLHFLVSSHTLRDPLVPASVRKAGYLIAFRQDPGDAEIPELLNSLYSRAQHPESVLRKLK